MARLVGGGALVALLGTFFSARLRGFAAVLPFGAGRLPASCVRRRQPTAGAGGRGVPGRRHRARNGGVRTEQRHGGVHLSDQRLSRSAACGIPAPEAEGT